MNGKIPVQTLMVEDDRLDAAHLRGVLAESNYHDYHVTLVTTMGATREILSIQRFDLVLLDLRLPNGQGVALVREVRRLSPWPAALTVVTGCEHNDEEIEALQAAADEYIRKGKYDDAELGRIIRNTVIRSRAWRETAALDRVQERIDKTLATCEASPNLPPYPVK